MEALTGARALPCKAVLGEGMGRPLAWAGTRPLYIASAVLLVACCFEWSGRLYGWAHNQSRGDLAGAPAVVRGRSPMLASLSPGGPGITVIARTGAGRSETGIGVAREGPRAAAPVAGPHDSFNQRFAPVFWPFGQEDDESARGDLVATEPAAGWTSTTHRRTRSPWRSRRRSTVRSRTARSRQTGPPKRHSGSQSFCSRSREGDRNEC